MGYFSNGTEGMMYEETYCRRCIHVGPAEGPGCPIWLAHLLHNYDDEAQPILDLFIPREGIENLECKMFVEAK